MSHPIELSDLTIYPIKSAAGIPLHQSRLTARGLLYDRRWLVCDRNGEFFTQRKFRKMALIQISVGETLRLSADGQNTIELPIAPAATTEVTVNVWGDSCIAWFMGDEAAQWLSQFLDIDCQLVYMPDSSIRPADHGRFDTPNSFSDAYPFLLISEASLNDLNQRLDQPVPMNRFRPNIVVKGCDAFAEDGWKEIKIGDIHFDVVKACARCAVPGIEQSTGKAHKEPLKTLATYRRWEQNIWFGQNLIARSEGQLIVGDPVQILA